MGFNIAIDGPAGAGKSSAAKEAARQLGFIYVDTGAMYRTIAYAFLRDHIDAENPGAVKKALDAIHIDIEYRDGVQHMLLNGEDVSDRIRTEEVSEKASVTSAIPAVRQKLLNLQRDMAASSDVIMDGRDIGTNILPGAQLKIYLTASVEERARRRYLELAGRGEASGLDDIKKEISERDYRDMHRASAPLRQADDAVLLDTSDMSFEEVCGRIVSLAREKMASSD